VPKAAVDTDEDGEGNDFTVRVESRPPSRPGIAAGERLPPGTGFLRRAADHRV
jgi:hypothetical protein